MGAKKRTKSTGHARSTSSSGRLVPLVSSSSSSSSSSASRLFAQAPINVLYRASTPEPVLVPKRRSERLRQQAVFERSQAVVDVDGGPGPSGLQAFEQLIEPAGPSGIQRVRSRSNENGINPPRVNQDGRISFEFGAVQAQMNGMRLRSGRVKPRSFSRSDGSGSRSSSSLRRGVKRKPSVPDPVAELPYRISHILDQDHVSKETQIQNSWSDSDKSTNIYLHEDEITLHRRPVSQSTDSIRGRVGYKSGVHVWEIKWVQTQRGTHACIGVATRDAPLRRHGYCALVGSNDESWGWDLGRNLLIHNDQNVVPLCYTEEMYQSSNGNTPYPQQPQTQPGVAREPFQVPDRFLMALDMDAGRLGFMSNGVWLGWAFGDFRGKELYPAVSCVWGHCEVTLKYVNYSHSPLSLQQLARRSVRHYLAPASRQVESRLIKKLNIAASLKRYLTVDGLRQVSRYSKTAKRRKLEDDSDSDINQN